MKTEKKNLRRISIVVTAQTKGNLERLAAVCGYSEIGRVVDKLTREKMISLHDFERKDNMNVTDVARAIFTHRNTVLYHLNKVKQQTGLDPRRFYDLVELVQIAQEVLESETEGV